MIYTLLVLLITLSGCSEVENKSVVCEICDSELQIGERGNAYCDYCSDRCSICDEYYMEDCLIYTGFDNVCNNCFVRCDYRKCQGCEDYYTYIENENTHSYCTNCVDDNFERCHFCEDKFHSEEQLIKVKMRSQRIKACADCCSKYLLNDKIFESYDMCASCERMFSGKGYVFINEDYRVCQNCVNNKGYKKCVTCKNYVDSTVEIECLDCEIRREYGAD